ncbi:MAG: adenylyltransferase/cytidyltransferase family protein [Bacteroidia bacterium]
MVPYVNKLSALEVLKSKIYDAEPLLKMVATWRFKDQKVVFTNGCFDILHLGHIDYLAKASNLGGKLIVALNSDNSVKLQNKGVNRPLQDQQSRAMILASLHFVDAVILFDDATPLSLIEFLKPDILVKGADYDANETDKSSKKYIVGSNIVKANGGEVKTIEFLEGYSTTAIENKIKVSVN